MVFVSSMLAIILALQWGEPGVAFAFVIAIIMEIVNIYSMIVYKNKAEKIIKKKYDNVINAYKKREKSFEVKDDMSKNVTKKQDESLRNYQLKLSMAEKKAERLDKQLKEYAKLNKELEKMLSQRSFLS